MPKLLFNSANAKEMAAKSIEARRKAEQERIQRLAEHALVADPKAEPDYISTRLARVRRQIEMLSDMLDEETDPNKLDRLASAIDRLDEMERKHAGRPLPGSLKPSQPRQQQRSATVEPIGPAPQSSAVQGHPSAPGPAPGQTLT